MFRLVLLFCFISITASAVAQMDELLNRLPGLWELDNGKVKIIEEWRIETKKKLFGKSYTIIGSDTTLMETISIERRRNKLYYIPVVKGQNKGKPVTFVLMSKQNGSFVFVNNHHDFPQRIIYRFKADDSLCARIEGEVNKKFRSSDFNYVRSK